MISKTSFGKTQRGEETHLYSLENTHGLRALLTDYGATLVEMWVPDRRGEFRDITLGFEGVAGYESDDNQYFGCTAGRYANRIAKGRFTLDGREYLLAVNNGPNHLHGGGDRALSRVVWGASAHEVGAEGSSIRFDYQSPDGEEGYPGELNVSVTYSLTNANELSISYRASISAPTVLNLTNHAYWNLAGHGEPTVLDHELQIFSDATTAIDENLIPTGELVSLVGTALDFRTPKRMRDNFSILARSYTKGYDHNFVLRGDLGGLRLAARLGDPVSGRVLEVHTTEPGLQLYSGNHLKGQRGKSSKRYAPCSAVCLEAQHFPDSVHHAHFPSVELRPGEEYQQITVHRFSNVY